MMFQSDTFTASSFAAKAFVRAGGTAGVVVVPDTRIPGAGGKRRRRRILLADGRIVTPRDDAEYRRIVEAIVAERPTAPVAKPRRRRLKGAVVQPAVPRVAQVQALPAEFYTSLEFHRQGVLNYLSILAAWQAWLAEQDEEETVEMLLMVS